ncbi:TetR/AcrR family transcriptional regulator [Nocardia sp. alder85J]|uniref:TetR/AcrR family transcriptional regulator n=1 Tax=Nocardia sp. alder85J TaxID=2862949 RepID=UPI001CD200DC|nr:TetR/AcrR family transcriptional regulator [Nocardia sp. alder85J]MCX4091342.1 TetR/AcrR family transcriptional regulator [Nocardia sp. alder85J]
MPRPSRRDEVYATAARIIREQGYSAATMDAIADQVGLNKGTLYHYYPSKSAILHELLSVQIDATLKLVGRVPKEGTATDRLRELIALQVDHVATRHDELVVFFQELPWIDQHLPEEQAADIRRGVDKYERFTKQLLRAGVRTGEFREIDVDAVLYSVIGILAYMPNWFHPATAKAQATMVGELTDFIMSGIIAK